MKTTDERCATCDTVERWPLHAERNPGHKPVDWLFGPPTSDSTTARPWRQGARLLDVTANGRIVAHVTCASDHPATEATAHANAAFIVRAVNAHDAMREALELLYMSHHPRHSADPCDCEGCDKARAALALAEGKD